MLKFYRIVPGRATRRRRDRASDPAVLLSCPFANRTRGESSVSELTRNPGTPPRPVAADETMIAPALTRTHTPLEAYLRDFKRLTAAAAEAAGIVDPIAFDPFHLGYWMIKQSVRGPVLPIEGAMVRSWFSTRSLQLPGIDFGMRIYVIDGISFVRVVGQTDTDQPSDNYQFYVVARADYRRLYKIAKMLAVGQLPPGPAPVMPDETFAALKRNTIDYLLPTNLMQIKTFGGRPKRGLILTGPPGNGKTSACRWIRERCAENNLEHKIVTPDDYRAARQGCNASAAVKELFKVETPGVIFFDDLDLALRDRSKSEAPEDQSVFLGAMDGMEVNVGVVYVFTTNLALDLIDPAFRRPGRIDVVLQLNKPTAELRSKLVDRWHADIRKALDLDTVLRETEGLSYAELDEHKNLMVLRYTETATWEWAWAREQFRKHREHLADDKKPVGFGGVRG